MLTRDADTERSADTLLMCCATDRVPNLLHAIKY
jgi:hypothetical protein